LIQDAIEGRKSTTQFVQRSPQPGVFGVENKCTENQQQPTRHDRDQQPGYASNHKTPTESNDSDTPE